MMPKGCHRHSSDCRQAPTCFQIMKGIWTESIGDAPGEGAPGSRDALLAAHGCLEGCRVRQVAHTAIASRCSASVSSAAAVSTPSTALDCTYPHMDMRNMVRGTLRVMGSCTCIRHIEKVVCKTPDHDRECERVLLTTHLEMSRCQKLRSPRATSSQGALTFVDCIRLFRIAQCAQMSPSPPELQVLKSATLRINSPSGFPCKLSTQSARRPHCDICIERIPASVPHQPPAC